MDIEELKEEVRPIYNDYSEKYFERHVERCLEEADKIFEVVDVDEKAVKIALILHDVGKCIEKTSEDHAVTGKREAEKILGDYQIDFERKEKVLKGIREHRGYFEGVRNSKVSKVVASADGLSHLNDINYILYIMYSEVGMGMEEGKKWLSSKIDRSWDKIMDEAKQFGRENYEAIAHLF